MCQRNKINYEDQGNKFLLKGDNYLPHLYMAVWHIQTIHNKHSEWHP